MPSLPAVSKPIGNQNIKNPRFSAGGFVLPKGALCAKISTERDTNDGKAAPPAKGVMMDELCYI